MKKPSLSRPSQSCPPKRFWRRGIVPHFFLLTSLFFIGAFFFVAPQVKAGDCYADPVAQYDWTGSMNIGAFMRNKACMDGSQVMTTIPKGTSVHVFGETDGWYYVEWNGGRGWVGSSLVTVTEKRFAGNVFPSYEMFMQKFPAIQPTGTAPATDVTPSTTPVVTTPAVTSYDGSFKVLNADLVSRGKGYILLQTESHGEAWYVDPVTAKRYYMKDGPTAYQMMRSFGLGITDADYSKIDKGDESLKTRLRGRIVLRAQAHGEAYYIHPKDLKVYYLKNGDEAYRIMRLYSLGISNRDLSGIPSADLQIK